MPSVCLVELSIIFLNVFAASTELIFSLYFAHEIFFALSQCFLYSLWFALYLSLLLAVAVCVSFEQSYSYAIPLNGANVCGTSVKPRCLKSRTSWKEDLLLCQKSRVDWTIAVALPLQSSSELHSIPFSSSTRCSSYVTNSPRLVDVHGQEV